MRSWFGENAFLSGGLQWHAWLVWYALEDCLACDVTVSEAPSSRPWAAVEEALCSLYSLIEPIALITLHPPKRIAQRAITRGDVLRFPHFARSRLCRFDTLILVPQILCRCAPTGLWRLKVFAALRSIRSRRVRGRPRRLFLIQVFGG